MKEVVSYKDEGDEFGGEGFKDAGVRERMDDDPIVGLLSSSSDPIPYSPVLRSLIVLLNLMPIPAHLNANVLHLHNTFLIRFSKDWYTNLANTDHLPNHIHLLSRLDIYYWYCHIRVGHLLDCDVENFGAGGRCRSVVGSNIDLNSNHTSAITLLPLGHLLSALGR